MEDKKSDGLILQIGDKIETKHILFLYGIMICLPSLVFILFRQSSYASGMIITSIVLTFYILVTVKGFRIKDFLIYSKKILLLIGIIFAHSFIIILTRNSFDFNRFVGSLFVLILMYFAVYGCVVFLNKCSSKNLDLSLKIIYIAFCVIVVSGGVFSIVPIPQYLIMPKPIFPFMEPSHFAVMFAPYFLWMLFTRKKMLSKILLVISVSSILIFMSNVTLASLIGLGIVLTFGIKKSLLVIPFIALMIIVSNLDISYYSNRVGVEGENNLSNLVWLQGWEEAYLNVEKTYGYGIGFQQFGVEEPDGQAANTILWIMKDYLNRYDGGTFGAKIIGEFGFLGLILILWILSRSYKSFIFLRKLKINNFDNSVHIIFYHCCILYFIIELFVRSLSYMAPSFFIFMVGIIGINLSENKKSGEMPLENI